jgi:endonuclease YncB( thermonuclease family)
MATGPVRCEDRGHDRYRRTIGLCRVDGQDLGVLMVSAGIAWAFTRYSSDYISRERVAIGAGLLVQ